MSQYVYHAHVLVFAENETYLQRSQCWQRSMQSLMLWDDHDPISSDWQAPGAMEGLGAIAQKPGCSCAIPIANLRYYLFKQSYRGTMIAERY